MFANPTCLVPSSSVRLLYYQKVAPSFAVLDIPPRLEPQNQIHHQENHPATTGRLRPHTTCLGLATALRSYMYRLKLALLTVLVSPDSSVAVALIDDEVPSGSLALRPRVFHKVSLSFGIRIKYYTSAFAASDGGCLCGPRTSRSIHRTQSQSIAAT